MRKYCKKKGVDIPDPSHYRVHFCNTTREQVTLRRELASQAKKWGEKNGKAHDASCKKPLGSPRGTSSTTHWVPHPRPRKPRPAPSRERPSSLLRPEEPPSRGGVRLSRVGDRWGPGEEEQGV